MNILDLAQTHKNKKVPAGTVLVLQGENKKALIILHSGLAELMSYGNKSGNIKPDQILDRSIRVGLIKGETVCGIMGLRSPEPYARSIRTVTDCIISAMPVDIDKLLPLFQSNIKLNLQVLRALSQRIESAVYLFNNYRYLWHKLASIQDSLTLAASQGHSHGKTGNSDRYSASFSDYSDFIFSKISEMKIKAPLPWDHNVLLGKKQDELGLYGEHDQIKVENLIDYQQFLFIKRLLRKQDQILDAVFRNDEPTNFYFFQFQSRILEEMLIHNEKLIINISRLIPLLFSDKGWINEVLNMKIKDENKRKIFIYYLGKFAWRCKTDIQKLLGIDLEKKYRVYSRLGEFEPQLPPEMKAGAGESSEQVNRQQTGAPEIIPGNLAKYKNLLNRILEFSDIPGDRKKKLVSMLNAFNSEKKKFELEPKLNKLKADFSDLYWQMYEKCFLKIIDTDLKSFIPGVMLHFGLLDEKMVSPKVLQAIDTVYSKNLSVEKPVSVMTLPYFLEKIYRAECKPSITDMGQSFTDVLKKQTKLTKKEAAGKYMFHDKAEDRVRYEIRQIASDTMKLLYGSRKRAFPVLCNEAIIGDISYLMLDPEKAASELDAIRQRDFSVFYREVVIHHKFGSDIVKIEVVPNFVLYPGAGSRMMLWQELDGAKRDTKGRIFLPVIYNEKLREGLCTVLGHFRWELQKTMAGAKWMDAVEGGYVGAYYDYINFYKKNPNITPEVKELVYEFIKKTRSDRERYTMDYINWVIYEYEGRLKLNNATRDIFYRYCPFPKEIRAEIAKKPIFTNLEMKYQNRANAAILKAESRKKKFEKSTEPVPEEYIDFLDFLQR